MSRGIKYRLLLLAGALAVQGMVYSQQMKKNEFRKIKTKAENLFDKGEYYKSLLLYERLLSADSMSSDLNFHAGVCKFNLKRLRRQALKHFLRCNESASMDIHYYKGFLFHLNEEFDLATREFTDYLHYKGEKTFDDADTRRMIEKCIVARKMILNPSGVALENAGSAVNTKYPEYVPLVSADGKTLFFTSRRPGSTGNMTNTYGDYFEDIYAARASGSSWVNAENIGSPVNTSTHDACVGLTPEGQTLLIYRTDTLTNTGDIYYSEFNGTAWDKPVHLPSEISSKKWIEASACFSPDGNTIYFSSNRPGGFGGKDLYRVVKLPTGTWSKAMNMGPNINTPFDEDAPFLHPDNCRLFFSSSGHENMGGFDVFYSTIDSSSVSKPFNLGYPLNTVDDDIYFVETGDDATGFISSDRPGGFGETDIYKIKFHSHENKYEVQTGNVFSEQENPLEARITVVDHQSKKVTGTYKSNHFTGKFILLMEPGKEYQVIVESEGYHSEVFSSFAGEHKLQIRLKKK